MFDIDACLIDSAPNLILTLDRAVSTPAADIIRSICARCWVCQAIALDDLFRCRTGEHTLELWSEYYAAVAVRPMSFLTESCRCLPRSSDAGLPLGVATSQGRGFYEEHFHKYGINHFSISRFARTTWKTRSPPPIRFSLRQGTFGDQPRRDIVSGRRALRYGVRARCRRKGRACGLGYGGSDDSGGLLSRAPAGRAADHRHESID